MRSTSPDDSLAQDSAPDAGRVSPGNPWPARLLLVFCCWHAAFLIYSIIPAPPAQNKPGHPVLDFYRIALGGRQQWNMFETIPVLHSLDVRFEGVDRQGRETIVDPVLPGFKPLPRPESARYYNAFYRLLLAAETVPFRDAYLRKVGPLLAAQRDPTAGETWTLVVNQEYTRNLFHSRRGGPISVLVSKSFDISTPDGDAP